MIIAIHTPTKQYLRVLIAPQSHQHSVFSVILILGIMVDFIILCSILEIEPFTQPPKPEILNFYTFSYKIPQEHLKCL